MYIMDYWDEDFDVYSQGISTYLTIAVGDGLLSVLPFLSEERREKLIENCKKCSFGTGAEGAERGRQPFADVLRFERNRMMKSDW